MSFELDFDDFDELLMNLFQRDFFDELLTSFIDKFVSHELQKAWFCELPTMFQQFVDEFIFDEFIFGQFMFFFCWWNSNAWSHYSNISHLHLAADCVWACVFFFYGTFWHPSILSSFSFFFERPLKRRDAINKINRDENFSSQGLFFSSFLLRTQLMINLLRQFYLQCAYASIDISRENCNCWVLQIGWKSFLQLRNGLSKKLVVRYLYFFLFGC